jgi:hypothetical protein
MGTKKALFSIGRSFLKLTVLSSLLIGSGVGLSVAFLELPYLVMSEIDEGTARKQRAFFIAFQAGCEPGEGELRILPYRHSLESPAGYIGSFRLTDGVFDLDGPAAAGESSASIRSETNNQNIQTTTVHVVGDLPWVSVSVYEVHGEEIVPLRLGQVGLWLLGPAFIVLLLLLPLLWKPVGRIAELVFPLETPRGSPSGGAHL